MPSDVDGKAHIHPSGTIVRTESSGGSSSGGGTVVFGGGTTKTKTSYFVQRASPVEDFIIYPNKEVTQG